MSGKIVRMVVRPGDNLRLTDEQIEEIERAAAMPITFDEDCPELTDEQLEELAQAARARKSKQKKQVIALRISPQTLARARAFGKGYTGFLSRLLDNAIKDPELVKKSL